MFFLPVVIPAVAIVGIVTLLVVLSGKKKNSDGRKLKGKDRNSIIKEANKRLAQNPKDADALLSLAELYYKEGNYAKALKTYELLVDMCATNQTLDEFDITFKYAISALRTNNQEEAYKSLMIARSMRQDVFEVNYNLGYLEYLRGNFEKAAVLLGQARKDQPEHIQTLKYFGNSLFKIRRFKESVAVLRKTIDLAPDDKDSLFTLAQAYHEIGQNEQAIKIFTHLRPDPTLGPSAALFAGTIHMNTHQPQKAIMDLEIGLRHPEIRPEILYELKYRLAAVYIKQQDISPALKLLQDIQSANPAYKDVPALLKRYTELNSNQNLQTFLIAGTSEFVTLCRKVVVSFFPRAKVRIVDISVHKSEYADILAEVTTKKWEDLVLFRFVRTTGQVGELILRDLYSKIKDLKAGRGFCLTAGNFTEGAQQFVEARLIDLIEKDALLSKLGSSSRSPVAGKT
jgi:tetratricopeptide (TPR) repeat protein